MVLQLPERFQIVNGDDYLHAGLHLLPMLGGTAFGCFISGPINKTKNRTSVLAVVSCVLILIGTSLFITVGNAESDMRPQYGFQAIFGLGVGIYFSAATMMSVAQASAENHAVAQGIIAQARVLGGMIGLSISTIILNDLIHAQLAVKIGKDELKLLYQSPLAALDVSPELKAEFGSTYAAAFATNAKVMTGVATVAFVMSLFTLERNPPPIRRHSAGTGADKAVPPSRGTSDVELADMDVV
jgi:hypothetical protein